MRFRDHRFPGVHPVVCQCGQRRLDMQLTNISARGARLAGAADCLPGQALRVELGQGSQPRAAVVRWVRDGVLGLRFDQPLEARLIAIVRKSVGHRVEAPRLVDGHRHGLRELR